jgi:dTDP-4-amino-4,6-dideoxygalactose transaminase
MNYYFPTAIDSLQFNQDISPELKFNVNSGANAIRTLLRSFNLPIKSRVAIPAFVCSSVKQAVEAENLTPILFDLKPEDTFWTSYDFNLVSELKIKAIILVHLYGFVHPDAEDIANFCEGNNIKLIHDAAQSYGINEQYLMKGDGIVYSSGPGKSTAAAGGAWIKNHHIRTLFQVNKSPLLHFQNLRARLFLKSRMYGYCLNNYEKALRLILNKIYVNQTGIYTMSSFQLKMTSYLISNLSIISILRNERYFLLEEAIKNNPFFKIICKDSNGLNFKIVFFVLEDIDRFKLFLTQNKIPYFSLITSVEKNHTLFNFKNNASRILEISCESSIPKEEIKRISSILQSYK